MRNRHASNWSHTNRRQWLALAGSAGLGWVAGGSRLQAAERDEKKEGMEVPAVEDLMREHGILRRALLVYSEASSRLLRGGGDVPASALTQTAALFRRFGEDYHERSLEEKHVFPPLTKAGGEHAMVVRTLIAQHNRGREITDYITAVTANGSLSTANRTPLANALAGFVRMYEHHAAIEDTVVFLAWKEAILPSEYRELSEEFEELEHRLFGEDGFEDAVKRISDVEQTFGLADLSALTAPPPPKTG